ncbi:carbohydrate ABC transporter permease [Paenibacillus roseipurpureus]|uniref:Carbohydrate ABC transporter permease n=1 Tax=Paenibacillus roseopurpureus TaxID=2918901 RepID=A0AA96LVI4_9BACL|nr:carbohydrate ABC transporter permease [Paenibacillus sp. MBLB1832]WNR46839.1 carbohydrate ABC transporter permease [Paenibacillus sp. MBLB1832]
MPIYRSERWFQAGLALFFIVMGIIMLVPMLHVIALSLSDSHHATTGHIGLLPQGFTLDSYKKIMGETRIWRSLGVTVYITVLGTLISLFFTSTLAYALSRPRMPGKPLIMKGIVITFIFSVPLIPYFLTVNSLHMLNTLWSIMLPTALGAFNVIIMKTFFQGLSSEIFDAGSIDGCSEFGIFYRLAIPLSKPVFATIGLFHAVGQWNSYFYALIFIRSKELYPIQIVLRGMIVNADMAGWVVNVDTTYSAETLQAGVIIVAILPIVAVYPFLQKYFVKGAYVGSLKE